MIVSGMDPDPNVYKCESDDRVARLALGRRKYL
jgi:hypothetical protein